MDANFDYAFDFVMRFEGYKSNDPDDAGGRTIFGISERSHPDIVDKLWDMVKFEAYKCAKEFYKQEYWIESGCSFMLWPWDFIIFDSAVNLGIKRALKFRRESKYMNDYLYRRIGYYVEIAKGTNSKFLRGWVRRVLELRKTIISKDRFTKPNKTEEEKWES